MGWTPHQLESIIHSEDLYSRGQSFSVFSICLPPNGFVVQRHQPFLLVMKQKLKTKRKVLQIDINNLRVMRIEPNRMEIGG